jgi:hypothetical protein
MRIAELTIENNELKNCEFLVNSKIPKFKSD